MYCPIEMFSFYSFVFLSAPFCYCLYLKWKSQRFNTLANKLEKIHYPRIPLIGHAYLFLEGLSRIIKICDEFKDLSKPTAFWLGHNLFIGINNPIHLEILLNSNISMNKPKEFRMFTDIAGDGLIFTDNPKWRKDRKLMNAIFKQKNLDSHVDIFTKHCEVFVENLQLNSLQQQFDVSFSLMELFFDIFFETSVGVNPEKYRKEFLEESEKGIRLVMMRIINPIYHIDAIFNRSKYGKEVKKVCFKLQRIVAEIFDSRAREFQEDFNNKSKTMFLDYLIELQVKENAFTREEILSELILFIVAAFDTCTSESSFMFLMLGMHQDVQEKLYQEVMQVLGPDRQVDYKSLSELTYMEKVIKETMRLFPVGPFILRTTNQELDLGDYILPDQSVLALNVFGLHRCEKYYGNPLQFDPERFSSEEIAKRHRYAYIPFSGGPRNCIGQKFAMLSMKTLFANIIRKFRIKTSYKDIESIKLEQSLSIKAVDGYPIVLSSRNSRGQEKKVF